MRGMFRSLLATSLLTAALASPWLGGCNDDEDDPFITPNVVNEPCDTDAVCAEGLVCCFAPGSTQGLCQLDCDTDCDNDAECEQSMPPDATAARCCIGLCEYVRASRSGVNDPCLDSADCDPGLTCDFEAASTECIGVCRPPEGTGGMGGTGAGGSGAGGSGGSGPAIAPHSVKSGTPDTTTEGCLATVGETANPARLIFDQALSGETTMVVEGTLSPVPQGTGITGSGLVQICTGGVEDSTTVTDCLSTRLELNTLGPDASFAMLDAQFNELDKLPWTSTATSHGFTVTVVADPSQPTASATLTIDGVNQGTLEVTIPSLAGTVLSLFFSQAEICSVTITPT